MKMIKDIFLIVVGNILSAIGIGTIALQQGISLGGVSGMAKVLNVIIPLPISILVWILNIVLFVLAFFFIGKKFAMRTIISAMLFPVLLEFAQHITVLDVLKADPLLSSILGGVALGTGAGLILRGNASSGGFDILAVIANKYWNIKTATVIAACDTITLLFQVRAENLLYSIYGILMIFITSTVINKIITKENNEVKMMIFSKYEKEIKNVLLNEQDCGLTLLHGETGYTNTKMNVIVTIMPLQKVQACKSAILNTDKDAFIVIENVQAAYTGNYYLRKPEDTKQEA